MAEARRKFEIRNKLGMHARAAAVFVQLANRYASEIKVGNGELEVSGKSIMGVLQLAAEQGSMIEVIVSGEDSAEALAALGELIDNLFGEGE